MGAGLGDKFAVWGGGLLRGHDRRMRRGAIDRRFGFTLLLGSPIAVYEHSTIDYGLWLKPDPPNPLKKGELE